MHISTTTTTSSCWLLLLLCCVTSQLLLLQSAEAKNVEKRNADEDLERLLSAIQQKSENRNHDDSSDDDDKRNGLEGDGLAEPAYPVDGREDEDRGLNEEDIESYYRGQRVFNSVTPALQKQFLDVHNERRRGEGASNMELMVWNSKLASISQSMASSCRYEHVDQLYEGDKQKKLGQSIAYWPTTEFSIVTHAMDPWFNEKKDYDYNSNTCRGKACGHYTAFVWGKSNQLGCGIAFCPNLAGGKPNSHYVVCHYHPGGNFPNQKPFVKGPACTQCDSNKFFCNNGLCDSTCRAEGPKCQCKAACKNGGTKTKDCSCTCRPGTMGPDCGDQCKDLSPKCGVSPGYPDKRFCDMWAIVKVECPKLCGICKTSRESTDNVSALKRLLMGYLQEDLQQEQQQEVGSIDK